MARRGRNYYNPDFSGMTSLQFAIKAHDSIGQVRQHGVTEPCWKHVERVGEIVNWYGGTPAMVDAGNLHDTVEDVYPENAYYSPQLILENFGSEVLEMVIGLTNLFTDAAYPEPNRASRQFSENIRISLLPGKVKVIKLADRLDNVRDIALFRGGFRNKYVAETRHMLDLIHPTGEWRDQIRELKEKILLQIEKY